MIAQLNRALFPHRAAPAVARPVPCSAPRPVPLDLVREPLSEPLPDPDETPGAFLGWFDSSHELRVGLCVIEHGELPGEAGTWPQ